METLFTAFAASGGFGQLIIAALVLGLAKIAWDMRAAMTELRMSNAGLREWLDRHQIDDDRRFTEQRDEVKAQWRAITEIQKRQP
jgi:hypothetical protein